MDMKHLRYGHVHITVCTNVKHNLSNKVSLCVPNLSPDSLFLGFWQQRSSWNASQPNSHISCLKTHKAAAQYDESENYHNALWNAFITISPARAGARVDAKFIGREKKAKKEEREEVKEREQEVDEKEKEEEFEREIARLRKVSKS